MAKCCIDRPDGLSSRPLSVFHPANATSDGWETPQTPQSHSPATNSCATDLIPRPSVPKSQVEVGWGCILSCMGIRCIGCILQVYSRLSSSRLACHAIQRIQRIQPYSHTRQYIIQRHTASLSEYPCEYLQGTHDYIKDLVPELVPEQP